MNNTNVSIETVEHIARLSRLEFDSKEKDSIKKDLNEIVNYFNLISNIDCSKAIDINKVYTKLREDVVEQSLPKQEVVMNAPYKNENSFIVPRVVE